MSHYGKLAQQIFLPAASRRVSHGAIRPWKSVQGDPLGGVECCWAARFCGETFAGSLNATVPFEALAEHAETAGISLDGFDSRDQLTIILNWAGSHGVVDDEEIGLLDALMDLDRANPQIPK